MAYGDALQYFGGEAFKTQRTFATASSSGLTAFIASATGKIRVLSYLVSVDTSNEITWREGATGGATAIDAPLFLGANGGAGETAPENGYVFETATGKGLCLYLAAGGRVGARATWCRIGSTT